MSREKQHVTIKNWAIVPKPYYPDKQCVRGNVYDHPRFADGTLVWTSPIVNMDEISGIVETENNIYHLQEQAV